MAERSFGSLRGPILVFPKGYDGKAFAIPVRFLLRVFLFLAMGRPPSHHSL